MSPEREAHIRQRLVDGEFHREDDYDAAKDLLAALDAERKAHAETRRAHELLRRRARVSYGALKRAMYGEEPTPEVLAGFESDLQHCAVNAACALSGHKSQHPKLVERWEAEKARADALEARLGALVSVSEKASALIGWDGGEARRDLDACLSDLTTAAQAYRDRVRAEAFTVAADVVNAEMQSEAVSRDRAYAAGRQNVGSHRQAGVEVLEAARDRLRHMASDKGGAK